MFQWHPPQNNLKTKAIFMSPLSFRQFHEARTGPRWRSFMPNNDENIWFMRFICVFLIGLHCLAYILPVKRVEVRQLQSLESKLTKLQAIAQIVTEWQKTCLKTTSSKCINDNNTKKTWATKTFPGKLSLKYFKINITHKWYVSKGRKGWLLLTGSLTSPYPCWWMGMS